LCWGKEDGNNEPCTFKPYRIKDIYFRGQIFTHPVPNNLYISHFLPNMGVNNNCFFNSASSYNALYTSIGNPAIASNLTPWLSNTIFSGTTFTDITVDNSFSGHYIFRYMGQQTGLGLTTTDFTISFNSTSLLQSTHFDFLR